MIIIILWLAFGLLIFGTAWILSPYQRRSLRKDLWLVTLAWPAIPVIARWAYLRDRLRG